MRVSVFYLCFLFLFSACQELKEPPDSAIQSDSTIKKSRRYYSGKPDIPKTELTITSIGIGKLVLGTTLQSVEKKYDSIEPISVYKYGMEWPGEKVLFPNGKWLTAEAIYTVEIITHIKTNNPDFKTKEGYHTGMPVDSVFLSGDTVIADPEQGAFEFRNSNIWFRIDPVKEKKYFRKGKMNFNVLKNSNIEEIFIICGDC
jgi:hypothetical protein